MEKCDLCARYCRVNRHKTIVGAACHTGERALVYRFDPHCGGNTSPPVGSDAGAIFFSYCNLNCVYCKKREVSQKGMGWEVEPIELANMMLALQEKGSRNISLVSPSHVVAQILAAVHIAAQRGLHLPLVYESDGYDSPEALALLDGVIDVYAPDIKYGDNQSARMYSHASDYIEASQRAAKEMYRQVGDLQIDERGMALRGLLVRHLALPGNQEGTLKVLDFIAEEISPHATVCILPNYRPCNNALGTPPLDRPLSEAEYHEILVAAAKRGLQSLKPRSQAPGA
jgi:putative pyruvate formate lyase activating enzyme